MTIDYLRAWTWWPGPSQDMYPTCPRNPSYENILQPTPSLGQNSYVTFALMDNCFECKICSYKKYGLKPS
jgi:hypothetical protein